MSVLVSKDIMSQMKYMCYDLHGGIDQGGHERVMFL